MKRCKQCGGCSTTEQNQKITIILLFYSFIIAMFFFAAVRLVGFQHFRQSYVNIELSWLAEKAIMFTYLVFEGALLLKILTSLSIQKCTLLAIVYKCISYFISSPAVSFLADLAFVFLIPLFCNQDKRKSLSNSMLLVITTCGYQLTMMYGRGYPMASKQSAIWNILGTIDYKIFLIIIIIGKELMKMDNGCFFFFGKFSEFAKLIGLGILSVFSTAAKSKIPEQCDKVKVEFLING